MHPLLALGDAASGNHAEWVAAIVAVLTSIVMVAVAWGGRAKAHDALEKSIEVDRVNAKAERDRDRKDFEDFKAAEQKRWDDMHAWQHDQDRQTARLRLQQVRVMGRLHRVEDDGGLTPPPKETDDGDDS